MLFDLNSTPKCCFFDLGGLYFDPSVTYNPHYPHHDPWQALLKPYLGPTGHSKKMPVQLTPAGSDLVFDLSAFWSASWAIWFRNMLSPPATRKTCLLAFVHVLPLLLSWDLCSYLTACNVMCFVDPWVCCWTKGICYTIGNLPTHVLLHSKKDYPFKFCETVSRICYKFIF